MTRQSELEMTWNTEVATLKGDLEAIPFTTRQRENILYRLDRLAKVFIKANNPEIPL